MQVSGLQFFITFFGLLILTYGTVPFLLGFVTQSLFIRHAIPKYVPWIIGSIGIFYGTNFSDKELNEALHNSHFLKAFLFIVSVTIFVGFMEAGIRIRKKIRDRKHKTGNKQYQEE